MYTLEELKPLIIEWAKEKDLIKYENKDKQWLKLVEECGELASAILKNDKVKQIDSIGDIYVVLVILEAQIGVEFSFYSGLKEVETNQAIKNIIEDPLLYCNRVLRIAENMNLDIKTCANYAWNGIKDRKGKTIGGTFIKD